MTGDDSVVERGERDRASALDIKLNRRLDLFKRQLIAAVKPERQSRLRASLKFHSDGDGGQKSRLARRLAPAAAAGAASSGSRARSLESRARPSLGGSGDGSDDDDQYQQQQQHGRNRPHGERDDDQSSNNSPPPSTATQTSQRSPFRCAIQLSPRQLVVCHQQRDGSPRHLIRMLAEQRNDDSKLLETKDLEAEVGPVESCSSKSTNKNQNGDLLAPTRAGDHQEPALLITHTSETTTTTKRPPPSGHELNCNGKNGGSGDKNQETKSGPAAGELNQPKISKLQAPQAQHIHTGAPSRAHPPPEATSGAARPRGKLQHMTQEDKGLQAATCKSKECQELREILAALEQDCRPSLIGSSEPSNHYQASTPLPSNFTTTDNQFFDPEEAGLIQRRIETQFGQRLAEATFNSGGPDFAACTSSSRMAELLTGRQDAMLELISTEINYINRLRLIRELFLGTLETIRTRSSSQNLLRDIHGQQLVSNVESILNTHLLLWSRHLRPMAIQMVNCGGASGAAGGSNSQLGDFMDPIQLSDAFTRTFSETFKPYYRFCIEQASCIAYIRRLAETNECFRFYLSWCEQRRECQRMRLIDLLACPMQRLTRYPLLLRTMLKQTNEMVMIMNSRVRISNQTLDGGAGLHHDVHETTSSIWSARLHEQLDALNQMILFTERFVQTVNLELKRRDEFIKLIQLSDCLSLEPSNLNHQWDFYNNQEAQTLLRSYASNFNSLMAPLFNCAFSCQRQVLFNSSPQLTNGDKNSSFATISSNANESSDHSHHHHYNNNNHNNSGSNSNNSHAHNEAHSSQFTSSFGGLQLGPIKFRDAQSASKLEATILVLTDQLLVCKHERQMKPARSADPSPKLQQGRRHHQATSSSSRRSSFYVYSLDNCRSLSVNLTETPREARREEQAAARETSQQPVANTTTTSDSCTSEPGHHQPVPGQSSLDRSSNKQAHHHHHHLKLAATAYGAHNGDITGNNLASSNRLARFERRRAASHSFERPPDVYLTSGGAGPELNLAAHSGCSPDSQGTTNRQHVMQTLSTGNPPESGLAEGKNLNFLSPARALTRLSSEQNLSSSPSSHKAISGGDDHDHLYKQQQQHRVPPLSQQYQRYQENSNSNCSINSSAPLEESSLGLQAQSKPPAQLDEQVSSSLHGSRQQSFQRQSLSFSNDHLDHQHHSSATIRDRDQTSGGFSALPRKLSVIRSPYPLERLAMHELSDGRSVLFCQLNDTRTIANSFVVYFSKNSQRSLQKGAGGGGGLMGGSSNQSLATDNDEPMARRFRGSGTTTAGTKQQQQQQHQTLSQVRLLVDSVREAQVRFRTLARLHQLPLADLRMSSLELDNSSISALEQQAGGGGGSLSFESTCSSSQRNQHRNLASCAQQETRSQVATAANNQRQLEWIADQHQMFMLSHGKHDELATNRFTYELSQEHFFEVIATPLDNDHERVGRHHSPRSSSKTFTAGVANNWRSNRPQLGRSMRISQEFRAPLSATTSASGGGEVNYDNVSLPIGAAANSSPSHDESEPSDNNQNNISEPRHRQQLSRAQCNYVPPGRSADSERDARSICSNSISLASDKQGLAKRDSESQASVSASRKNLSSLRRQNVVLSASGEQHTLLPAADTNNKSHLPAPVTRSAPISARRRSDSSSDFDSLALTSLQTDDGTRARSHRNLVGITCGSYGTNNPTGQGPDSAVANDQSPDDTLWRRQDHEPVPGGHWPLMSSSEGRQLKSLRHNSALQSIRSVSTDHTISSPIAITLAVPRQMERVSLNESVATDDTARDALEVSDDQVAILGEHELDVDDDDAEKEEEDPQDKALLTGCLDMKSFGFTNKHHEAPDVSHKPLAQAKSFDKRHSKGIKSRLITVLGHLHLM